MGWGCELGVGLRAVGLELGCELGAVGLELWAWSCGLGVDLGLGACLVDLESVGRLGERRSTWRASVDLPIGGFFDIIREAKFLASIGPVAQLVRARAS